MRHGVTSPRARARAFVLAGFLIGVTAPIPTLGDGPPLPESRLGTRTAPLLLLSRPDVRADLGLTPAQAESAERILSALYVRAAALRGRQGPEVLAARRAIDEEQRRWLDAELSDAQRARLAQIDLQWEGPAAVVSRPIVAESLGLSPHQRTALQQAIVEHEQQKAQGPLPPDADRQLAERFLAALSEEQRTRWLAMLGPPFRPQPTTAAAARDRGR